MMLELLRSFTVEKYIVPKMNRDFRSRGYWRIDFERQLLVYNWENGAKTRPIGPYEEPLEKSRKTWSAQDEKMYKKFYKEWRNAHKASP